MNNNPLHKYFRSPKIHILLPSKGYFNKDEHESTITNEIPVYSMTIADEIISKSPDGLINGHSVEKIVQSCAPSIKNPRNIPSQDMDAILLAIKYATSGNFLKLEYNCPKCKTEIPMSLNIRDLLDNIMYMEENYTVRVNDDIIIYLKPYTYESITKLNIAAIEQARIYQSITTVDISEEERMNIFNESFEKISNLNLDLLSERIINIVTPSEEVTNKEYIKEFIKNVDKIIINDIQDKLKEISKTGVNKEVRVSCTNDECKNEWDTEIIIDPSHFFE